jgi:hypothetical protein
VLTDLSGPYSDFAGYPASKAQAGSGPLRLVSNVDPELLQTIEIMYETAKQANNLPIFVLIFSSAALMNDFKMPGIGMLPILPICAPQCNSEVGRMEDLAIPCSGATVGS